MVLLVGSSTWGGVGGCGEEREKREEKMEEKLTFFVL